MIARALEHRGAVSVLEYICDHPGCTVADIIRSLDYPGENATWDRADRLVKAGLVERTDGHVMHGKRFLTATAKGQRIIEVLREVEPQ